MISVGSLAVRGLNLGIDFKGGVQITFRTAKPTPIATVRDQTAAIGRGDAVVQGRGNAVRQRELQELPDPAEEARARSEQNKLSDTRSTTTSTRSAEGTKNVSSSFGRQIARAALLAIFFSMLIITLYITIRFRGLAFAVPVIAAMLHDVLITVGVYSITGREVTEATVAAVLTVLGYSIYDTIIIFDRDPREHADHAPRVVRDDHERLAVGDDPPLAGDDVHHPAAGRRAVLLRRRRR